jgi:excisionase family DNA binding protein
MEALMTPEQVADRLQLAPRTIYLWLRQGRLRGIKLGSRWRVKREDLDAYLERQQPAGGRRPDSEGEEEAFDVMGWIRAAEDAMREVRIERWRVLRCAAMA